jgi:blue copper oxidase
VRVARGQTVRVHVRNELDEATNVHWHGLIVPSEADGQPGNLVAPGAEAEYTFAVRNRPGTYWFHPHPHGRTAEQAYQGLAGLFIVTDAEEAALGLPAGAQDIPLVIQDRRFDAGNQLVYIDPGMAGMMDADDGYPGRPHSGQRSPRRDPAGDDAALSPARAQRLKRTHLQAGLEHRRTADGDRHGWWSAGSACD